MHTDEFYNVLVQLLECTNIISDDRNHLIYTKGYDVYKGIHRKDVVNSLDKNIVLQEFLKKKLINLYNNTLQI